MATDNPWMRQKWWGGGKLLLIQQQHCTIYGQCINCLVCYWTQAVGRESTTQQPSKTVATVSQGEDAKVANKIQVCRPTRSKMSEIKSIVWNNNRLGTEHQQYQPWNAVIYIEIHIVPLIYHFSYRSCSRQTGPCQRQLWHTQGQRL